MDELVLGHMSSVLLLEKNRSPQGVNHETRPALVFGWGFSSRRNRV